MSTCNFSKYEWSKSIFEHFMTKFHELPEQPCIVGGFAPLATLVDENADLDSMVTHFNKAVTDTAAELLGEQRRKRKPWVTPEILDLCDQRRDLKKKRGEPKEPKTTERFKKKDQERDEDGKRDLDTGSVP